MQDDQHFDSLVPHLCMVLLAYTTCKEICNSPAVRVSLLVLLQVEQDANVDDEGYSIRPTDADILLDISSFFPPFCVSVLFLFF